MQIRRCFLPLVLHALLYLDIWACFLTQRAPKEVFSSTCAPSKGGAHPSAPAVCLLLWEHIKFSSLIIFISVIEDSFCPKIWCYSTWFLWYPCVLGHQSSDIKKLQISRNRTLCASTTNVLRIHVTIYIWSTSFDADPLTNIYDPFYIGQQINDIINITLLS